MLTFLYAAAATAIVLGALALVGIFALLVSITTSVRTVSDCWRWDRLEARRHAELFHKAGLETMAEIERAAERRGRHDA